MPPVYKLEVPEFARAKLWRRNISAAEAQQLSRNRYLLSPNHRAPRGRDRELLVGETNGGRRLTLVVEPTADPTAWRVITGWDS